jgi:Zn-dependent hydrolases, including glyoxylases
MSHAAADRYAWIEPAVEDLGGGIYRIPLPLPLDGLKAVNVYAITDPGGVDLIDAGMAIVAARERLTEALRELGYGLGDVRNFLVTHIHIDHYSLAVELRREFRTLISLGEDERANMLATREMLNGTSSHRVFGAESLRRLGAAELIGRLSTLERHGPMFADWEDPDRWVADGTDLDLRTRTLRAVHTPGHTLGHLVYHDAASEIMFAGDHVLPHITPSIGFEPAGNRMALRDYLARWPGRSRCPRRGCCPPTARSATAPTSGCTSCWPTTTRGWPRRSTRCGRATPQRSRWLGRSSGRGGSACSTTSTCSPRSRRSTRRPPTSRCCWSAVRSHARPHRSAPTFTRCPTAPAVPAEGRSQPKVKS